MIFKYVGESKNHQISDFRKRKSSFCKKVEIFTNQREQIFWDSETLPASSTHQEGILNKYKNKLDMNKNLQINKPFIPA